MISIRLEGADILERKLKALEAKTAKKIVRKAVRAGAKPVLQAAKANAANMVGGTMGRLIKKNIKIRAFRKQRRGSFGVGIQTAPDVPEFIHINKGDGKRQYIPAAIEYGHDNVPAIPFMRKAADEKLKGSAKIIGREIAAGIEATAKK